MATDKRLDQVSTLTDFDYALIVKGDQVAKASKQQLAELVGNLLYGATNASSLATVVAEQLVYSLPTNINDATKQGVYYKSSYTIEGVCSNADVLIHVMKSPSFIVQMLFDVSVIPAAWYRTRRWNGDWVAWSKIA